MVLSYCDDIMCHSRQSDMEWFFAQLSVRFDIKPPMYLSKGNMLDHLRVMLLEDEGSVFLLMQNYIKVMAIKLGVVTEGRKARRVPMSTTGTCACTNHGAPRVWHGGSNRL